MGYSIKYVVDNKYVKIDVEGKVNFKLAKEYSTEAVKLAHENGCHTFIIDHKKTDPEASGIYKLHTDGAALEKFGFRSTDKIAIVISTHEEEQSSENNEHDAKWSNFRYFTTIEKAKNWLDIKE